MSAETRRVGETKTWMWWILGPLGLIYLFTGGTKLLATDATVEMWTQVWGYPLWFMFVIGVVELAGAIMLLVPQTRFWGASLLAVDMIGAMATHIRVEQFGFFFAPLALFAVLVWIAYRERPEPQAKARGRATY